MLKLGLGESEGTTGKATIDEIGRRRSFGRTVLAAGILLLVQQPMMAAVRDSAGDAGACAIPGRLSLLVDGAFILTYVVAAYRGHKYVRCLRQPRWTRLARTALRVTMLAGLLDVLEDVRLWRGFAATSGTCAGLSTGWLTWVMRGMWLAGALLLTAALILAVRGAGAHRPGISFRPERDPGPDDGRLVICCSGGGIRSASFCLGALQLLCKREIYDRASSVVGVSGGGYMAAAFHVMRQKVGNPYAPGTPELARLRRQTRYLLQGGQAKFRAALSVLYGLSINLLLIGITLRAVAWVLGWFLYDLGVVTPQEGTSRLEVHWKPDGSPWFLVLSTALLGIGVVLFVLEKSADRLSKLPDIARRGLTTAGGTALAAGLPVAVLLLGVPGGLDLLNQLVRNDEVSAEVEQPTLPRLLLDLVDPNKQGVASFLALAVALVGLGRTVWKGLSVESKDQTQSKIRHRILAFLRTKVAPWLGSAIFLVAVAIVLLRWTGGYATDQSYRSDWSVALVLAAVAAGVKLLTDANRTSLHPYYRERLQTAYLMERAENGAAVSLDYSTPLLYSENARPPKDGGPQLVVAAVANVTDADFVPAERDCVPFIFDPADIGIVGDTSLPAGGRRKTGAYELEADFLKREVTVPAAMAISGAAFSPLTRRANARTRPVRLLLALLNARFGVWLPNPYWNNPPIGPSWYDAPKSKWAIVRRYLRSMSDKPGAYRLLREAVGSPSMYDRRLYVTDGGHYDNLGLVEALRRRPAQVIVIDASSDPEDRFTALGEAIATARMDHGILVDLDPSPMIRNDAKTAARAWVYGIATHTQPDDGSEPLVTEIFYLKALRSDNPSWDVQAYAAAHPDFPRRSTGDQFYGEWDFEAYRALGHALAESMVDHHRVAARLAALPGVTVPPSPNAPSPNGKKETVTDAAT